MHANRSLLVVGARPESLGYYVADLARGSRVPWKVRTVGISGAEDEYLDLQVSHAVEDFIMKQPPFQAVVCTAGRNVSTTALGCLDELEESFDANVAGPMSLLGAWLRGMEWEGGREVDDLHEFSFVGISSNSARIARSTSLAYCASKAALSMALRCAAREMARTGVSIYGYEPGWINGTPMSQEVAERLDGGLLLPPRDRTPPHRIPSGQGIDPERLARMIVRNLDHHGDLNGCLIRVDGGEQ